MENEKWKMENKKWKMENEKWKMENEMMQQGRMKKDGIEKKEENREIVTNLVTQPFSSL